MTGRFATAASVCVTALSAVVRAQAPAARSATVRSVQPATDAVHRSLLQQITDGRRPSIGHVAIKVAPFDRGALMTRLRELSAGVLPSADEPDVSDSATTTASSSR